jgi:hypothetical protein
MKQKQKEYPKQQALEPIPEKPTYTVQEYAYRWSVNVRTVYLWIENSLIEAVRTPSGGLRIPKVEMDRCRFPKNGDSAKENDA